MRWIENFVDEIKDRDNVMAGWAWNWCGSGELRWWVYFVYKTYYTSWLCCLEQDVKDPTLLAIVGDFEENVTYSLNEFLNLFIGREFESNNEFLTEMVKICLNAYFEVRVQKSTKKCLCF